MVANDPPGTLVIYNKSIKTVYVYEVDQKFDKKTEITFPDYIDQLRKEYMKLPINQQSTKHPIFKKWIREINKYETSLEYKKQQQSLQSYDEYIKDTNNYAHTKTYTNILNFWTGKSTLQDKYTKLNSSGTSILIQISKTRYAYINFGIDEFDIKKNDKIEEYYTEYGNNDASMGLAIGTKYVYFFPYGTFIERTKFPVDKIKKKELELGHTYYSFHKSSSYPNFDKISKKLKIKHITIQNK
jgi:hypothetical protein